MVKRVQLSTDKQIQALKGEGTPYEHAVAGGHGLRVKVSATGRRVWYYRYRNRQSGALERIKIGESPPMTLSQARAEVARQREIVATHSSARLYRDVERKRNAKALAADLAQEAHGAYTTRVMLAEYLREASRELSRWKEVERCFTRYVDPPLGELPAHTVLRKDVLAMLAPLVTAEKFVQANRVLAYLRKAFSWGVKHDRIANNPCVDIDKHRERPRERFLSDTEIARFLANLPAAIDDQTVADSLHLVLLTGLRIGEAVAIRREDIDAGTLTIPHTKGGRPHHVYLSSQALDLIARRKAKSKFLFPMMSDPARHLREDRVQNLLRLAIPSLKTLPFTAHDLRRSFATGLAKLKCPRLLISLALNHAIPGITSRYDKHTYEEELREWWATWGAHIAKMAPQVAQKCEQAA